MDGVVAKHPHWIGDEGADGVIAHTGTGTVAGTGEAGGDAVVVDHAAERTGVARRCAVSLAAAVHRDRQLGWADGEGDRSAVGTVVVCAPGEVRDNGVSGGIAGRRG